MSSGIDEQTSFRAADSASANLYARARKVMPGGNSRTTVYQAPHPPYAVRGEGAVIVDAERTQRLDFLNNYTSLIHGHADPDINAAVIEQLQHGTAFAMPTELEVRLAELLTGRIPSMEQVRFTNSGSEAVMMAIKGARAFTGRPKIVKFEGCYHGSYDFVEVSLATTPDVWGDDDPVGVPYSAGTPDSVLDDVIVLRYNDSEMAERRIAAAHEQIAAVIVDLMPLRIGMIPGTFEFVSTLRRLCDTYGIVLIFDEVISLRVAYGGAQSVIGVTPDMTTAAKIIGGGFPVGAVGGSAQVMSVFDPSEHYPRAPHGGTFNANPITMVAGLVAMEKLTPAEFERLDRLGDMLREGLAEAMDGARVPGQVTGAGSLAQIHLHDRPLREYRDAYARGGEAARVQKVFQGLLDRGIFTAPALSACLSTPMDEGDISTFVGAFAATLRD